MKFFIPILVMVFSSLIYGQEFGTWENTPPADMEAFQANLAAPPITQSGKNGISNPPVAKSSLSSTNQSQAITAIGNGADQISPEIQTLAENLSNDVLKIHRYVTHNIAFEAYYGSKKGATLTLLEKRGNAHDQCALLVALLRAAGHEANYIIGSSTFSYAILRDMLGLAAFPLPEQTDAQIVNLFGGSLPAGFSTLQARQLLNTSNFLTPRGYPIVSFVDGETMVFDHVWVEVIVGSNNYLLNPSVKASFAAQPIDILTNSGYNRNNFMTAAGGTPGSGSIGNSSITSINETSIHNQLTTLSTNLSNWIRINRPNISAGDLIGQRSILPRAIPNFQSLFPNTIISTPWATPTRHAAIPESEMSSFELRIGNYNYSSTSYNSIYHTEQILMPMLCGQKLSLTFTGNTATFSLDESVIHTQVIPSSLDRLDMDITATHDHFQWVWNGSVYVKTNIGRNNRVSNTQMYLKGDNYAYAIPYGFKPSGELLRKRQAVLDDYLRDGLTNTSNEVRTELLNIMGLTWIYQTSLADELIVAHEDIDLAFHHRIGRVAQEDSYYIDFVMQFYSAQSRSTSSNVFLTLPTSQLFHSCYEHSVVEHIQDGNSEAASTIKLLHLANQAGTTIYRVNASNWQTGANIRNLVTGYSANELAVIDATVNSPGGDVLLPRSGDIELGDWEGAGFILRQSGSVIMGISGGLSGGFNSATGQFEFAPVVALNQSDPSYYENGSSTQNVGHTPEFLERYLGADPVDMATGAFVMEKTEMELGQALPRGLTFIRNFNSNRRYDTAPGLGGGWTHNLYCKAFERTSTKGSLGLTSARHVIPTLLASAVTRDILASDLGSAKEQVVAALIAQWASEQITDNAVGIVLGEKTLEFVEMPDGSYEAPPGSIFSLVKNGSNKFELTERNSSTMVFGTDGWIENITDLHGNQTNFSYSNDRLSTVSDSYGRTFTFTWNGEQITKIADSTSREISFSYSGSGDLTSVTDVEGKVWSYTHTSDHQIKTVFDPDNRIITENTYDSLGRVAEQKSMGDANKLWKIRYTGSTTEEEDPEGNIKTYFFDRRGRAIGSTDSLGHNETRVYDGEDHVILTISENSEITAYDYDVDHNILKVTDPLNKFVSYSYDSKLRVAAITNKNGDNTSFTYNDQNQVLTKTDPLGHVTTYSYHPDGLLKSVTDAENVTTTTDYDSMGHINKVTLNDGTFTSFTNNARGDILTKTDAEGRTITKTWNKRRQLLTSTAPSIPGKADATVTNTYDNSGNLASMEDPEGNVVVHSWNALGKIVTSTEPTLPAGGNTNTTLYDSRDWIQKTSNSLNHEMEYEYDAAKRLIASEDPLGRRTENIYDSKGQLLDIEDPLNRITKSTWNARSEVSISTDAENENTIFEFDDHGNRTKLINRRGKEYSFVYDDAHRLTSSSTPLGKTTAITYFDNDLVKTKVEPSSETTTYTYTARNLVHTKSDPTGVITYGYDDSGLLESITEGSDSIYRTFDERGSVKTYTNEDGDTLEYEYDGNGNLTKLIYPDGKEVDYTYNARNLLKTVTDWSNRVTTYEYDRLGRMVGIIRPNGTTAEIKRDAGNQIEVVKESANGQLFNLLQFTYDAAGQVGSRMRAPLVQSTFQHPSYAATYDDDNRLLTVNSSSVIHDDDGNMTLGPISLQSGNVNLAYNSRNQLTSADGVSYIYDAEGHRRTKTDSNGTTRFTIDANANMSKMLVKYNPDGSKTFYVHGFGLLYEADESDNTKTYHYDQVGSTIVRTDDNGKVIGRAEYSAYGTIAMMQGDMNTPLLYNGQWGVQTDENGLLNMRARYYSPYLMRFINSDPLGFSGGQNWYSYADGNPVSALDPFGLWGWRDTLSITLDFVPIVGTVKGAVELIAGHDYVAGEDVHRGVAATGLALSIIPGAKGTFKAGTRIYTKVTRVADDVPLKQVTDLRRPALSDDLVDTVRDQTQRNANGNFVDPNTGRELLNGKHHIGHIAGRENRRLLREAEIRGYDQRQLTDWVNQNPKWFQVEGAAENLSHRFELPGNSLPWHRVVGDDTLMDLGANGLLNGFSASVNRFK